MLTTEAKQILKGIKKTFKNMLTKFDKSDKINLVAGKRRKIWSLKIKQKDN